MWDRPEVIEVSCVICTGVKEKKMSVDDNTVPEGIRYPCRDIPGPGIQDSRSRTAVKIVCIVCHEMPVQTQSHAVTSITLLFF